MGVEPATYALRVRCSATELHRPIYKQAEIILLGWVTLASKWHLTLK